MAAKGAGKKKSVLVVGGGGREHALAWAFNNSRQVDRVFVAPGNAGTAEIAENFPVGTGDIEALVKFARKEKVDLTVVGPEAPLAEGIVDRFAAAKLPIFGPTKKAARVESSKVFAKELALREGIPTASAEIFDDVEAARRYVDISGAPCVIKADGLAAGKGVTVAMSEEEAFAAIDKMMVEKILGAAGERILIEDYVSGEEASILAITDGERTALMVPSQDHKRLEDGDGGPNTGGMGAYAPAPVIDGKMLKTIAETIIEPTFAGLAKEGITYRGCLYAGLIVDFEGPKLLEFNCRFGDPEAQAVLPLLQDDLFEICAAAAAGKLPEGRLNWRPGAAVSVVAASKGYPGKYEKGCVIKGLDKVAAWDDVIVFHAGTAKEEDKTVTAGGRVLAVTALGISVANAVKRAYDAMGRIHFSGMQYRRDIGYKAVARGRE
ncbi:MAG TPA: phosphoribosylamine--glycine ligase [bacterium]|nr:phosphoribosylamine--glycine ligase [bacterium]